MRLGRQRWLDVFNRPAALLTVALVTIHQSVIASSSYFLTKLVELLQQGGDYERYFFLYLVAMVVPYIPGCLSLISLQYWVNQAHQRFTCAIARAAYGLTEIFGSGSVREQIESIASRNSFVTIKDYLTFAHGFLGFVLNSGLSMLVLGLLLPGNLLAGYFISVIVCAFFILMMNKAIGKRSADVESRFIRFSDNLSAIWENTTLGNRCNFLNWSRRNRSLGNDYYQESNSLQALKQCGNLVLAAAALGPTIYLIIRAVEQNSAQPPLVAAIIVNLTRVFHILNSLNSLVNQLLEWPSMNARFKILFEAEKLLYSDSKIFTKPLSQILLNDQEIVDYESVVKKLSQVQRGRFTVRGGNGSGKSTLLLTLKNIFGDSAIMLPAHHGRLCWRSGDLPLSTGQRTLRHIHEIVSDGEVKYFLFDEWDANLDKCNAETVDQLLNEISMRRVVIEVRH